MKYVVGTTIYRHLLYKPKIQHGIQLKNYLIICKWLMSSQLK